MKTVRQVATLGVSVPDRRVISLVCNVSASREKSYVLQADGVIGKSPDILIVDGDQPADVERANAMQQANPGLALVVLYRDEVPAGQPHGLRKRALPVRLMPLLDTLETKSSVHTAPPAPVVSSKAAPAPAPSVAVRNVSSLRPRVLVVDDSVTVRAQIEICLGNMGVDSVFATTVAEAQQRLAEQEFSLVLLDVVLPDGDGYAICKNIRRARATQTTPVVMLTSKSSPFDRVRGTLAGCDSYLTKPVDRARFTEVVNRHLHSAPMPLAATP